MDKYVIYWIMETLVKTICDIYHINSYLNYSVTYMTVDMCYLKIRSYDDKMFKVIERKEDFIVELIDANMNETKIVIIAK